MRTGDDIFIWKAGIGLTAHCRATSNADEVRSSTYVPWPDPGRYKFVWSIDVLAELEAPRATNQADVDELAGRRVMLNQWVRIDEDAIERIRRTFGDGATLRSGDTVLPALDIVYMGADHRTVIERAIAYRRGQRAFRAALMESYRERCIVTETETQDVLEAAHIYPYRGKHTDRIDNGLLLRSDVHTLFDLYKLTILPTGTVRVHPSLHGTDYDFDQRRVSFPVAAAARPSVEALEWHNGECAWLR